MSTFMKKNRLATATAPQGRRQETMYSSAFSKTGKCYSSRQRLSYNDEDLSSFVLKLKEGEKKSL